MATTAARASSLNMLCMVNPLNPVAARTATLAPEKLAQREPAIGLRCEP